MSLPLPGFVTLVRRLRRALLSLVLPLPILAQPVPSGGPGRGPTPAPAPATPAAVAPTTAGFGRSLPGLSFAQQVAFADGQADFIEEETPANGLGPIFNDVSCAACHSSPTVGGASTRTVTRFGHRGPGGFDPLAALGGSLLQARALPGVPREVVPAEANVVAHRVTTPLFGAGLIEAIPDEQIVLGSLRPKPAGIQGRVSVVDDVATGERRVGRFGWKAQQATLLAFSGDAYVNEMGITNRLFPVENAPNGNTRAIAAFDRPGVDDQTDPVDGRAGIDRAADYMRFLAPPPRLAATASSTAGERTFNAIGCAACHTPSMTTGRSDVPALDRQPVALYSDLLLHDMGGLGDGIEQGTAGGRDLRTAPLWGLRVRSALLHDGRASTPDAAIRAHEGEGSAVRDAYVRLSDAQRRQLLDFLGTL